jgi:hypothetical protein
MAHVTGASFPITLAGNTYELLPLSDKDYEEINNWGRKQLIDIARASFDDEMSQDERDEILGAALRESRSVNFMTPDGAKFFRTPMGIARILWQGLRKRNPKLELVTVSVAIRDNPEDILEAMNVFKELNLGKIVEKTPTPKNDDA